MHSVQGSTSDSILKHPFVAALSTDPPRQKTSPLYTLALLMVTLVMVLLPLIYVGLIGLVGYATYLHAVHDAWIISETRGRGALVAIGLYVGGIAVGIIGVLFMVKPLFAPRRNQHAPLALNRKDEPLMFAFVDRLSDAVGSPRPTQINIDLDTNASAGFEGMLRGVVGGNIVLTIGLPLVASMTLTQFVGVLAHEFGHFAQRGGMRLTYVIRTINGWFARVVYDRDGWDESLDNVAADGGHWLIQLPALVAKLFVYLSRKVLWLLMMIGHLVSSIMLRQMEFDADIAAARVIGSKKTQDMLGLLPLLGAATNVSFDDLSRCWRDKKLPISFPGMIASRLKTIPGDVRQKLCSDAMNAKTGWFDSHPSTGSRISALAKQTEPGVFSVEASATQLFTNFDVCSKLMTQAMYRENLGRGVDEAEFIEVETVEADRKALDNQYGQLVAATAGLLDSVRPAFPTNQGLPDDANAIADELFACREQILATPLAEMKQHLVNFAESDQKLLLVTSIESALSVGIKKVDGKPAGLLQYDDQAIRLRKGQLAGLRTKALDELNANLVHAMRRLEIGLLWRARLDTPTRPEVDTYEVAETPANPAADILQGLRELASCATNIEDLRQRFVRQQYLLQHAQSQPQVSDILYQLLLSNTRKMAATLSGIKSSLAKSPHPLQANQSLGRALVPEVAAPDNIGQTMQVVGVSLNIYFDTYLHFMVEAARLVESVESEIGLEALAMPAAQAS
jgi:Zn-dependent protease with chaperone function